MFINNVRGWGQEGGGGGKGEGGRKRGVITQSCAHMNKGNFKKM
jgi:hypothetical protein